MNWKAGDRVYRVYSPDLADSYDIADSFEFQGVNWVCVTKGGSAMDLVQYVAPQPVLEGMGFLPGVGERREWHPSQFWERVQRIKQDLQSNYDFAEVEVRWDKSIGNYRHYITVFEGEFPEGHAFPAEMDGIPITLEIKEI